MNGPAMGTQDLLKEFYFEFKQGSYLSALNYLKELEANPEQKTLNFGSFQGEGSLTSECTFVNGTTSGSISGVSLRAFSQYFTN